MFFFSPKTVRLLMVLLAGFCYQRPVLARVSAPNHSISLDYQKHDYQIQARELYLHGMDFFNKQEYEAAIEQFKKALVVDPNYLKALNGIGISFGKQQKYDRAIAIFNEVIKQDSRFYNAYYNRGYIYQQQGRKSLALQDFNLVLELTNNSHVSALMNRSLIYIWLEDYSQAKQDLDRVIEVNPQEATAYYNRALINATLGDRKSSYRDLEVAENLYKAAKNTSGVIKIRQVRQSLKF